MHKWKSIQVLGLLAVVCPSIPMVLAADDLVYPACDFAEPIIYQSPGSGDVGAAANNAITSGQTPTAPQAPAKPEREPPHSALAIQPAESFNDRYIALGLAAGLLVFAFFRKKPPQSSPAMKDVGSSEFPSPAEPTTVEPAVAEPAGLEPAVLEPAVLEPAVLEPAVLEPTTVEPAALKPAADDSIAGRAIRRNLVVPVDFSPNSEFAIRLALVWTKPNDRVKIVYACDLEKAFPPENLTPSNLTDLHPAFESIDSETTQHWSSLPWVVVLPLAMEIVERWAVDEFERLRQTIPIDKRECIEFLVVHGDPVDQIVSLSEKISAELIVLVAHRHSSTDRLITGSHADKLLHGSRIPVMVVCEPFESEPGLPQEILITTDYSSESLPVFLVLKDLIQDVKPNITVLTVETAHEHHPKASAMLEGLEKVFRSLGLQLRNVKIDASNVEDGILDYVKTHKPQLIAMSSHGRLGFAELLHPSVAKAVLHDAGVPILVVHGHSTSAMETVGSLSDFLRIVTG